MSLSLRWVVVDCDSVADVSTFWAAALERETAESGQGWASLPGDPHLFLVEVSETKTAKNRMHLDFDAADREAEVRRLVDLGAKRVADHAEPAMSLEWTTLADPEGNEFCVVQAADETAG